MKVKDIRGKNKNDLEKLLAEKREALRKFRFDSTGSKVKNIKEGATIKKDIARIMTELRAQEIAQ